jgi:hypothetical protein
MEAPLVRIAVEPSPRHGLRKSSQLMIELDLPLRCGLTLP